MTDFDIPKRFAPESWQALVEAAEKHLEAGERPSGGFWENVVEEANARLESSGQEVDIDDIDGPTRRDILASAGHEIEPPVLVGLDDADLDGLDDGIAGLEPSHGDYEHDDLRY